QPRKSLLYWGHLSESRIVFKMPKIRREDQQTAISPSVERAIQIIEALAQMPEGAGVTDLQRSLGYPVSSIYGVVMTLAANGWVHKDPETHKYRLTPRLFAIGSTFMLETQPIQAFHEVAREIVAECRETVHLGILEGKTVL